MYWLRPGIDANGLVGIRVLFKESFFKKTLATPNVFFSLEAAIEFITNRGGVL